MISYANLPKVTVQVSLLDEKLLGQKKPNVVVARKKKSEQPKPNSGTR